MTDSQCALSLQCFELGPANQKSRALARFLGFKGASSTGKQCSVSVHVISDLGPHSGKRRVLLRTRYEVSKIPTPHSLHGPSAGRYASDMKRGGMGPTMFPSPT